MDDIKKGIVFYTDCRLDAEIATAVQSQLNYARGSIFLVSVSLQPLNFGDKNIVLNIKRGHLAMFRQILAGIENSDADVLFLCEHDVLYHPSHFDFIPEREDIYYYDLNVWKLDAETGKSYRHLRHQVSGLCARRKLLLEHYQKRVERVEREGRYDRHISYEPGRHKYSIGIDSYGESTYMSSYPRIDIKHSFNMTGNQFRNPKKFAENNIVLHDEIPGWGRTAGRFKDFLRDISSEVRSLSA